MEIVFVVVGILCEVFVNFYLDYDIILVFIFENMFDFVNFIGLVGGG